MQKVKKVSNKEVLILVNHEIVIYNFRKELILSLLEKDYTVYISSPNGEKIKELESLGCIHIETAIDRRGVNPIKDLSLLMHYQRIFKEINPDIILSYTIKPNIYGGLIARLFGIPFMATITGLGSALLKEGILQKIIISLYKVSFRKVQRVFFQNSENLDFFMEHQILSREKTKLVAGSGVNLEEFSYQSYPGTEGGINFVYIGRIMEEKGVIELFEAARYFKKKEANVHFHVLGFLEDDLKEKLQKLVEEHIIIYHGQQSDIRPFLKQAHAIIHPSYHEGLSNVLLEAAASGRPILASDIPGCRETFEEGVTGLSFEAKSRESLIKTINQFIALPNSKKKRMGLRGRQKIEEDFDRQSVVEAYLDEINR